MIMNRFDKTSNTKANNTYVLPQGVADVLLGVFDIGVPDAVKSTNEERVAYLTAVELKRRLKNLIGDGNEVRY